MGGAASGGRGEQLQQRRRAPMARWPAGMPRASYTLARRHATPPAKAAGACWSPLGSAGAFVIAQLVLALGRRRLARLGPALRRSGWSLFAAGHSRPLHTDLAARRWPTLASRTHSLAPVQSL